MSRDYDPALDTPEDYGFDAILEEMEIRSTGSWKWDNAHLCFTGKDADLDPTGRQALELMEVTEEKVVFALHTYMTVAGCEAYLNTPPDLSEDDFDAVREIYLEQMYGVICGSGLTGEWDGDDWVLSSRKEYTTPLLLDDEGVPKVAEVVDAMVAAVQEDIAAWEKEAGSISDAGDKLAGWKDDEGNDVPEGTIVEGSAYQLWCQQQENEQTKDRWTIKIPVISTAHAPDPVALDNLRSEAFCCTSDDGSVMFALLKNTGLEWADKIGEWALKNFGDHWVRFDPDGDIIPEFTNYEEKWP